MMKSKNKMYWTGSIRNRLKKIEHQLDDNCDVHYYLMGDGRCNCHSRRTKIIKLAKEISEVAKQKLFDKIK